MAEKRTINLSVLPTIYFYVNKDTEAVEYVSMYSIFGITVRPKGSKWTMGTRTDLEKFYSDQYQIWSYDWANEDDTPGSGAAISADDEDEWDTELVQAWGRGEDLTKADIEGTCKLVNDGEYVSAAEAEKIPGDE